MPAPRRGTEPGGRASGTHSEGDDMRFRAEGPNNDLVSCTTVDRSVTIGKTEVLVYNHRQNVPRINRHIQRTQRPWVLKTLDRADTRVPLSPEWWPTEGARTVAILRREPERLDAFYW